MTREEIIGAYSVDSNLVIQSPGKFEAESAWAPYFWDQTGSGCCDNLDYPDGQTVYVVTIDEADRAQWPEIGADIVAALLEESESGFVSCSLVTQSELDGQESDFESACEESDNDEESDEEPDDSNTIMACQDCLMYIANGDLPDERPDLESDIQSCAGVASGRICAGDSDKDDEFSWSDCECCGSKLGGSRHQLVIMPE